ncbi:MAG: hypothetical protein BRC22_00415 [Parcubacteria group bacterium QH_9_35_7]|nr:MAG: hypothetical protein BRC22_00415 [Parcubacteria group bacterium QH_9_35_7]
MGVSVILLIIASYSLPVLGILDVNMFPPSDTDKFTIEVEKPIGTPLEKTEKLVKKIENKLQEDEKITSYVVNIGTSLGSTGFGSENKANFTVNLVNKDERESSNQIVDEYQNKLSGLGRANISVTQRNTGPEQEAPVVITIKGNDLDTLDQTAKKFEKTLTKIEGTENVKSSVKDTNGEFVINIDRQKAMRYGISTNRLASILRNTVNGTTATTLNQEGKDLDIIVKTNLTETAGVNKDQTDIETIRSLNISTPQGEIPLSSFADIKLKNNRIEINHKNGNRVVEVTSYTSAGTTASEVFNKVRDKMNKDKIEVPKDYSVSLGGENEDIQKSFADMFRAMILAVLLIASLLVLQFESFKQAIIILCTIPLALIGVFPGLTLLDLPLSFPGIIGIVALVGIVVNNAILLIATINKRKRDREMDEAIAQAGKERLRPILLTTITTVLGILPLAITEEAWRSLGFAIIFGLLFSTLLTLVVVPVLYRKFLRS